MAIVGASIAGGLVGGALVGGLVGAFNQDTGVGKQELLVGIDDAFAAQSERILKVNIIKRGK